MALTGKRRLFVEKYFLCGLNGAKAARLAGYSINSARQTAYDLLQEPEVKAEIEARLKAEQMGADETLYRLKEHSSVAFDDFFDLLDREEVLNDLYRQRTDLEEQLRDLPPRPEKDAPEEDPELSRLRWRLMADLTDVKGMIRDYELGDSVFRLNLEKARDEGKLHLIKGVKWDKNGRPIVELPEALAAIRDVGRHHKLFTDKSEVKHDLSDLTDEELEAIVSRGPGRAGAPADGAAGG
jgi:hypothetical protein